jgi:peptide/nickel transport system ATP-binding protein
VDLQQSLGVAFLFISHDLSVVVYVSDRAAVMYLGQIVELADRASLWDRPAHPYTRALLDSVPRASVDGSRRQAPLAGELPSPFRPPSGCRFHTRCPIAVARCQTEAPALRQIGPGHQAACHLAEAA